MAPKTRQQEAKERLVAAAIAEESAWQRFYKIQTDLAGATTDLRWAERQARQAGVGDEEIAKIIAQAQRRR